MPDNKNTWLTNSHWNKVVVTTGTYSLSTARQDTFVIAITLAVRTESLQDIGERGSKHDIISFVMSNSLIQIPPLWTRLTQAKLSLQSSFPSRALWWSLQSCRETDALSPSPAHQWIIKFYSTVKKKSFNTNQTIMYMFLYVQCSIWGSGLKRSHDYSL